MQEKIAPKLLNIGGQMRNLKKVNLACSCDIGTADIQLLATSALQNQHRSPNSAPYLSFTPKPSGMRKSKPVMMRNVFAISSFATLTTAFGVVMRIMWVIATRNVQTMGRSNPDKRMYLYRTERMLRIRLLAVSALIVCTAHTSAAQQPVKSEAKSPVLCSWMVYSSVLHAGQTCKGEADSYFLKPLKAGVNRIEAFVLRNSSVTAQNLAEYNSRRPSFATLQCTPNNEMVKLYESFKQQGIKQLQQDIDALLVEERPALWGPCL